MDETERSCSCLYHVAGKLIRKAWYVCTQSAVQKSGTLVRIVRNTIIGNYTTIFNKDCFSSQYIPLNRGGHYLSPTSYIIELKVYPCKLKGYDL